MLKSCVVYVFKLALVGAILFGVYTILPDSSDEQFAMGDCIRIADDKYEDVACEKQEAKFTVFAIRGDLDECVDVPGSSRAYRAGFSEGKISWYCVGDKGTDLSKAINGVDRGECVVVYVSGSGGKASCEEPGSRPVLKVVESRSARPNPNTCGEADGTDLVYSYGLEDQEPRLDGIPPLASYRILCLGGKA